MELRKLLSLISQKINLIIAIMILFVVGSAVVSALLISPKYESKATMIIRSSNYNEYSYNDILLTQKLVNTYIVIILSDSVLNQVSDNLGLGMSSDDLRDMLNVSGIGDTEIISVKVTDTIPRRSMDIANEITRVSPKEIMRTAKVGNIELIDHATLPKEPISPNYAINAFFAGLIAFILTLVTIVLKDQLDKTIKTPADVENLLDLTVLGQIPSSKRKKANDYTLVDDEDFFQVEAYNTLRTNIEYSIINNVNKTFVVTSSVSLEGKSHIIANLGVFLAHIGYNVLLVDCDFRKPKLNRFFDLPSKVGLTNVLYKRTELDSAINKIDSRLHVLCTGPLPPNSVEILSSKQMKDFLKTVSGTYNYILIDTPPSAYLADASVLGPIVNGVLLVIKYGSTPADVVLQAVSNLKKVNANITGAVISQVNIRKTQEYKKHNNIDHYYYKSKKKKRR